VHVERGRRYQCDRNGGQQCAHDASPENQSVHCAIVADRLQKTGECKAVFGMA